MEFRVLRERDHWRSFGGYSFEWAEGDTPHLRQTCKVANPNMDWVPNFDDAGALKAVAYTTEGLFRDPEKIGNVCPRDLQSQHARPIRLRLIRHDFASVDQVLTNPLFRRQQPDLPGLLTDGIKAIHTRLDDDAAEITLLIHQSEKRRSANTTHRGIRTGFERTMDPCFDSVTDHLAWSDHGQDPTLPLERMALQAEVTPAENANEIDLLVLAPERVASCTVGLPSELRQSRLNAIREIAA